MQGLNFEMNALTRINRPPARKAYGSERNNKLQAPPDLKIGPNKFQKPISNDQIIGLFFPQDHK
jgi:hypothetical protein